MAQQDMTPKELAEFLKSQWESDNHPGKKLSIGPLAGVEADDRTWMQIANASNVADAMRIADQLGVALNSANVTWRKAMEQADVESDPGWLHPSNTAEQMVRPILTPEQARVVAENRILTEENEAFRAMIEQGEEEEETYSPLLFPNIGLAPPDQAAHMKMVTSDDYDPWGDTGRDMSTREIIQREIMVERRQTGSSEELDWERDQYLSPGGYVSGTELLAWTQMSPERRGYIEEKMVRAGLLEAEDGVLGYNPGAISMTQMSALRVAMAYGNIQGIGYDVALDRMIMDKAAMDRLNAYRDRNNRSGVRRAQFSVPASLREIPDYESLEQETHNLFRQRLGRDLEDYEMGLLADHLQERYREANKEKIKAARAAFYQAQGGGSGVMEVEVPNPGLRAQKFIEEQYAPEIERLDQTEDTAVTNRMMIDAITRGSSMVGR